jgi:hypothetical protein
MAPKPSPRMRHHQTVQRNGLISAMVLSEFEKSADRRTSFLISIVPAPNAVAFLDQTRFQWGSRGYEISGEPSGRVDARLFCAHCAPRVEPGDVRAFSFRRPTSLKGPHRFPRAVPKVRRRTSSQDFSYACLSSRSRSPAPEVVWLFAEVVRFGIAVGEIATELRLTVEFIRTIRRSLRRHQSLGFLSTPTT